MTRVWVVSEGNLFVFDQKLPGSGSFFLKGGYRSPTHPPIWISEGACPVWYRLVKPMNCKPARAVRLGQPALLAILLLRGVNLAHATTPDLSFSPTTLDFKYTIGNPLPAAQTLQIKSTGTALTFTIPQVASQWISLSAYSGTTPASIKVYVNPTSLPSGAQQATITVNAPQANATTQTYMVTLEVSDPPPMLQLSP